MDPTVDDLIGFLQSFGSENPGCSKRQIAEATADHFHLEKTRSVYHSPTFAVRFSSVSGASFSNGVLSLSALRSYDDIPFVVCVVRSSGIELLLANTSFLKKISHSSHQLRVDNVRGTFLGHDIMRESEGIKNAPENFHDLFEIHSQFSWEENLERLVEATNDIAPTGAIYKPSESEISNILSSPGVAARAGASKGYRQLNETLDDVVFRNQREILRAGTIPNVNIRGNMIEQIVTESENVHSLEDLNRIIDDDLEVLVDIKTKIMSLKSNPKGYNIDKFLSTLSSGKAVVSFYFIGIDLQIGSIGTCLISVLDQRIVESSRVQFHWAGRNSRGVIQLSGDLSNLFEEGFSESIDIDLAQQFIQGLIDLHPLNMDR